MDGPAFKRVSCISTKVYMWTCICTCRYRIQEGQIVTSAHMPIPKSDNCISGVTTSLSIMDPGFLDFFYRTLAPQWPFRDTLNQILMDMVVYTIRAHIHEKPHLPQLLRAIHCRCESGVPEEHFDLEIGLGIINLIWRSWLWVTIIPVARMESNRTASTQLQHGSFYTWKHGYTQYGSIPVFIFLVFLFNALFLFHDWLSACGARRPEIVHALLRNLLHLSA